MKKVIILALSCLMLGSCTLNLSDSTKSAGNTGTGMVDSGSTKDAYKKSIDTASIKITDTQEFNNCMQSNINMCIQSVGMQLAQKNKDVSLCNELPKIDQKESCKFGIVMTDAIEKENPELCKTLSGVYVKQCSIEVYRNQAQKNKDVSLCKKIDEIEKQGSGSTNESTIAPMMSGADQCVFTIIMSNTESVEKDCTRIENEQMQEMCKNSLKNRPKMIVPTPAK